MWREPQWSSNERCRTYRSMGGPLGGGPLGGGRLGGGRLGGGRLGAGCRERRRGTSRALPARERQEREHVRRACPGQAEGRRQQRGGRRHNGPALGREPRRSRDDRPAPRGGRESAPRESL